MSYMFEVYYRSPADTKREAALTARVAQFGGQLDFREEADDESSDSICLTFEFDDLEQASLAADSLRRTGEHVEGPICYAE